MASWPGISEGLAVVIGVISIAVIVKGVETLKRLSLVPEKGGRTDCKKTTMEEAKRQGITPEAAETKFLK